MIKKHEQMKLNLEPKAEISKYSDLCIAGKWLADSGLIEVKNDILRPKLNNGLEKTKKR